MNFFQASEISSITDKADGIEMDNSAKLEHIKTLKVSDFFLHQITIYHYNHHWFLKL